MPAPAWQIRLTRARTGCQVIAVQADGKILVGGEFHGRTALADSRATTSPGSMPSTGLADSFDPNANGMLSLPSRCRRTARFWWAAISRSEQHRRTDAQFYRPTRCLRPAWLIRLTRTRLMIFLISVNDNRGADGRQDFGGRRLSTTASADRRAISSPGSMPPLAWPIRSTRTRTILSSQSRCRRTARFWSAVVFGDIGGPVRHQIARLDATTGLADSFDPNAEPAQYQCPFNRGAGGRENSSGRGFHHRRAKRGTECNA